MATLVFQQSLDDSKNNNDTERTCGGTHTHAEDDTHLTRHILLLFGGGGGCYPVYSALLCLYDCVLHSGHMKETVCEKEKKKKKATFLLNIIVTVTEQQV